MSWAVPHNIINDINTMKSFKYVIIIYCFIFSREYNYTYLQGAFLNCSAQISVLKRKTSFNQRGSFVHREFHGTEFLIGCPLFFHFGTENSEEQLKKAPCKWLTQTFRSVLAGFVWQSARLHKEAPDEERLVCKMNFCLLERRVALKKIFIECVQSTPLQLWRFISLIEWGAPPSF